MRADKIKTNTKEKRNMNKKMILVIALIGIGLYALPQTMALFAGQHSFVNIDAAGNQIDCVKCHGDVKAELAAGDVGTDAPHAGFECEFCHRVKAGEASGDNAYSQIVYGAASGAKRTLIVTERDMEAGNVPVSMTGTTVSTTTLSGVAMGKNKVSACYKTISATAVPPAVEVPCNTVELAETFYPPATKAFQATSLYNSDGTPKDSNTVTQLGTFDASKVNYAWGYTAPRSGIVGTWGLLANFSGAGSEVSNAGTQYHAASLVSCLECHGGEAPTGHHDAEYGVGTGCNACHYAGGANKGGLANIMAAGFGLGVTDDDDGSLEVHKAFVTNNDGILEYEIGASNTACVACHTHVSVDISYTKPTTVEMTASMIADGSTVDTVVVGADRTTTYSP